jgi:hypothetical protein
MVFSLRAFARLMIQRIATSHAAVRANFNRNLVCGTADAAGANFNLRPDFFQCLVENAQTLCCCRLYRFAERGASPSSSATFLALTSRISSAP